MTRVRPLVISRSSQMHLRQSYARTILIMAASRFAVSSRYYITSVKVSSKRFTGWESRDAAPFAVVLTSREYTVGCDIVGKLKLSQQPTTRAAIPCEPSSEHIAMLISWHRSHVVGWIQARECVGSLRSRRCSRFAYLADQRAIIRFQKTRFTNST